MNLLKVRNEHFQEVQKTNLSLYRNDDVRASETIEREMAKSETIKAKNGYSWRLI